MTDEIGAAGRQEALGSSWPTSPMCHQIAGAYRADSFDDAQPGTFGRDGTSGEYCDMEDSCTSEPAKESGCTERSGGRCPGDGAVCGGGRYQDGDLRGAAPSGGGMIPRRGGRRRFRWDG
jgi:hypothetical protein